MYTVEAAVTEESEADPPEDTAPEEAVLPEEAVFVTVTTHLYFFPSTFAVIVAVPALLAVTFPVLLTAAIRLLDDIHVTASEVPRIFRFFVLPAVSFSFELLIEGVTTLTLHLYPTPSTVAVMVVEPFFLAVTSPKISPSQSQFCCSSRSHHWSFPLSSALPTVL